MTLKHPFGSMLFVFTHKTIKLQSLAFFSDQIITIKNNLCVSSSTLRNIGSSELFLPLPKAFLSTKLPKMFFIGNSKYGSYMYVRHKLTFFLKINALYLLVQFQVYRKTEQKVRNFHIILLSPQFPLLLTSCMFVVHLLS